MYNVEMIPVEKVYSDSDFNCRGHITPFEVADLAKDIERNDLQFPIAVQPKEDIEGGLPDGFDVKIIAGHRRFAAWKVLKAGWDKENNPYLAIPAMIKTGLSDIQARILNLSENLKRKNLNILQEAKAIEKLYLSGMPRDTVAMEIGVSSGWVQVRFNLLTLPPEIQAEAAAGTLNQHQIKQLYSLKTKEEQFEAVRAIKQAKDRGAKAGHVGKRQKQKTNVKKVRNPGDLLKMIEVLAKATGYGLQTRVLAWAAGNISTEDFFNDIRKYCADYDLNKPSLPEEF